MTELEKYFAEFKSETIGDEIVFPTPYGEKKMIYADWIASGRLYRPIEERLLSAFGPFVGNTHTETSETGTLMTRSYHHAHRLIKEHVHANEDDVIITCGTGMTGAIVKFQRILGLKTCGRLYDRTCLQEEERPVVFLTHMEHHSNQTSWYETAADVVVLDPDAHLRINTDELRRQLEIHRARKVKIGSFTACSNVTGIRTDYRALARLMHEYGGWCFVDFAAVAPYDDMDMHPADPMEKLDAVFFSPHKFLGGPGTPGVLIFDRSLYRNLSPDQPGGGTVEWTNPWGEYRYIDDIEIREDGGTPGFLQAIKAALCLELKQQMNVEKMHRREAELLQAAFEELIRIPGLHILADEARERLGVISCYLEGIHYNLVVRLLSDRYGIQVRGGCACAGTYGHYLLNVDHERSRRITERIDRGDYSEKPGWIRLSLHPTMTDAELETIVRALHDIKANIRDWESDYRYNNRTNEFTHRDENGSKDEMIRRWYSL